jgi:hypothetical protein
MGNKTVIVKKIKRGETSLGDMDLVDWHQLCEAGGRHE